MTVFSAKGYNNLIVLDPIIQEKKDFATEFFSLKMSDSKSKLNGSSIMKVEYDSSSIFVYIEKVKDINLDFFSEIHNFGTKITTVFLNGKSETNSYIVRVEIGHNSNIYNTILPLNLKKELLLLIIYICISIVFQYLLYNHWKDYEEPWKDLIYPVKLIKESLNLQN
jgi:hypothetical protein